VGLDRRIAPADPLLRFLERLHHGIRERALFDYYRGGWSAHRLLRQILDRRFGDRAAQARILDFGSGYGRTTRFLVREHPRERITIADVMADAVAFQRETFGVAGRLSTPDPDALSIDGRFDLVVAISVFTHFNPADFVAWLARLHSLLLPGGILVFTVNDERTMLPGRELDPQGAWFEPASENERLDPRRYGSTWVNESFVARALERATRSTPEYRRLPRGLWASQDVYVVAMPGGDPLPDPLAADLEPAGVLEQATLERDGSLVLRGWAIMPDGAAVARVEASVDGRVVAATVPDRPRADVAARFAATPESADRALPGWELVLRPPSGRGFAVGAVLTVVAWSQNSVGFTLQHESLADLLVYLRSEALHHRIGELEHQVRLRDLALGRHQEIQGALWWGVRNRHFELKALKGELEVSHFWKLRNRWWSIKRRLLGRSG
jgi:SAM-dependent methyltransferase